MKINFILILSILFNFIHTTPSKDDFNKKFIEVASKGNPTVVSIISETVRENNVFGGFGFGMPKEFEDMFPQFEERGRSLGSGVIIDEINGYIVTNNHVVERAESIKIVLFDDREYEAEIIGKHEQTDLAVLKIDAENLKQVDMGNSDNLSPGEWVIAIGSPFGINLNHTVTAGIISATGRSDVMSARNFEDFIQHDAAINPGNSGGGLFNLDGELIGINNAIATDGWSRTNAGVGFAIPINQTKRIIEDLITMGDVKGAWLGISFQEISENLSLKLNLNDTKGVMITQVLKNSPAETASLERQDVIIEIDGKKINGTSDLRNIIFHKYPGTEVNLTIIRKGKKLNKIVILSDRPSDDELYGSYETEKQDFDLLGLKVETDENGSIKVTEVKKESSASKEDIKSGDLITQIDEKNIENIEDYYDAIANISSGDMVLVGVTTINQSRNFSQTYSRYIAIKVD
ncbi:MAG: protease [Candidatus Marinimicrobia bacterium]|nr:protease [Candidatus Neomarinimicrobiota bacterium]